MIKKQTAEEAAIRNVMEVWSDGGMDGVTQGSFHIWQAHCMIFFFIGMHHPWLNLLFGEVN